MVACGACGRNPRLPSRHVVLADRLAVRGETACVAEVVAVLPVAQRQDRGHPPGENMLAGLLAAELARRAALDGAARADICHPRLMRFAGARRPRALFGGDDIKVRARGDLTGPAEPEVALAFLSAHGAGASRLRMPGGPAGMVRLKAAGVGGPQGRSQPHRPAAAA